LTNSCQHSSGYYDQEGKPDQDGQTEIRTWSFYKIPFLSLKSVRKTAAEKAREEGKKLLFWFAKICFGVAVILTGAAYMLEGWSGLGSLALISYVSGIIFLSMAMTLHILIYVFLAFVIIAVGIILYKARGFSWRSLSK